MNPPLYDAHNHFHDAWFDESRSAIVDALPMVGLRRAVVNGACEEDWPVIANLARQQAWILPSFGVHPWDVGNRSTSWAKRLREALVAEPTAQVGEIGLDRWMLERAAPDDPRLAGQRRAPLDEQREVFATQLALATELGRAASVHCLDAFGALLEVLQAGPVPARGFLLHAYSGPSEMVPIFAKLGAYFSFNGSFLAERANVRREVFRRVPLERLLVETDAPATPLPVEREQFCLPVSPDGSRVNHPGNIAAVYAGLAELLGEPLPLLAERVEANFIRLFCRP